MRKANPANPKTQNSSVTGQSAPNVEVGPVSKAQAQALKPMYHITPSTGWMNDPNGMFQNRAGIYHVFYQWNPVAPIWGSPYWGHVISKDMVHWERMPPALVPDTDYDYDGVFSGSATLLGDEDGTPILFYTGVSNFSELQYYEQVQAIARPVNASDPKLKLWKKSPNNPLISQAPQGGTLAQFRDPVTAWKQDGLWYTVIGSMESCFGTAALYSSPDFQTWQPAGQWASQASTGQANVGECVPPAVSQPGMGQCDQFGAVCHMWECPDVFQLGNDTWVLKWSDQSKSRNPYSMDWYVLGTSAAFLGNRSQGNISTGGEDIAHFQSTLQSTPQSVDYGSIYASKTFATNDGRRVWMGWVFETSTGCVEQCSGGTNFTDSLGWQGAQTLPREVSLDADSRALIFNPIREVTELRSQMLYSNAALALPSNGSQELNLTQSTSLGRQIEVQIAFAPAANMSQGGQQPFSVGIQISTGQGTSTLITVNGTAAATTNGTLQIAQAGVYVDRSKSGAYTNATTQGRLVPLPASGLPAAEVSLRVFVDRSLLEVFALDGRGRVTSRIYPMGTDNSWGVSPFGTFGAAPATANVTVWEMGPAFDPEQAQACC
ncbi:g4470 [Coccomyxa elongata]